MSPPILSRGFEGGCRAPKSWTCCWTKGCWIADEFAIGWKLNWLLEGYELAAYCGEILLGDLYEIFVWLFQEK